MDFRGETTPDTINRRMSRMSHVRRFDHVGITVADLDAVTAFFVALGLEVENRMFVEGLRTRQDDAPTPSLSQSRDRSGPAPSAASLLHSPGSASPGVAYRV
jgi:catechol 2,3-dioxygenase-like lactoylglutathione lyase family enzyme